MTSKITGDNSVVPLNKVKDDTSVFVRLWQRGKKILTPLRDILDTIADVEADIEKIAMGTSSGVDSLGLAKGSVASGNYAVALGHDSKAVGDCSVTLGVDSVTYGDDSLAFGEQSQTGMLNPDVTTKEDYPYANIQYSSSFSPMTISGNSYYGYPVDNGAAVDVEAFGETTHVVNDTGYSCFLFAIPFQNAISTEYPNNIIYIENENSSTYIGKLIVQKTIYPIDGVTQVVLLLTTGLTGTTPITDSYLKVFAPTVDYTTKKSKDAIAFGPKSLSVGEGTISFGIEAKAYSYSAGKNAISIGSYSISIDSVVFGPNNFADGGAYAYNIVVGNSSRCIDGGVVVGGGSYVAKDGTAIGNNTSAKFRNSVAIGKNAAARSDYQIVLGDNAVDENAALIVARNGTNLFKINPDAEVFIMKDGGLVSLHALLGISPTASAQE